MAAVYARSSAGPLRRTRDAHCDKPMVCVTRGPLVFHMLKAPKRFRSIFALNALAVWMTTPSPARAQDVATAEALFNKGMSEMNAGRYPTACPAIEESYRLDPRPGTLFTLAECAAKAGRVATAVSRYEDYLQLFARLAPKDQAKQMGREKSLRRRRRCSSLAYLT